MKKFALFFVLGLVIVFGASQQLFTKYVPEVPIGDINGNYCTTINGVSSINYFLDNPDGITWLNHESSLIVSGFVDSKPSEGSAIMTDFSIVRGGSGEVVFITDSLTYYLVTATEKGVTLSRLEYLPIGDDWKWENRPVSQQVFTIQEGRVIIGPNEFDVGDIRITDAQRNEFKSQIQELIAGKNETPNWQHLMRQALVCSISGDAFATEVLLNFEDKLNIDLAGSDEQCYNDCLAIYSMKMNDQRALTF